MDDYYYDEEDDYCYDEEDDYCYECTGYGDDYYYDEETHDLVCACYECPYNENNWEDGYWKDDV